MLPLFRQPSSPLSVTYPLRYPPVAPVSYLGRSLSADRSFFISDTVFNEGLSPYAVTSLFPLCPSPRSLTSLFPHRLLPAVAAWSFHPHLPSLYYYVIIQIPAGVKRSPEIHLKLRPCTAHPSPPPPLLLSTSLSCFIHAHSCLSSFMLCLLPPPSLHGAFLFSFPDFLVLIYHSGSFAPRYRYKDTNMNPMQGVPI